MTHVSKTITRRSALEAFGTSALGLAGAALLGCGSTSNEPGGEAGTAVTSRAPLPMQAPVVTDKPREGGIFWIPRVDSRERDPHTASGPTVWRYISESGIDLDPVSEAIRPHVFASWEVADSSGTSLVLKLHPRVFMHDKPPWNGRQFTAEDAAWNLERLGGLQAQRLGLPKSAFPQAPLVANIVRAQAVDTLTLRVTLSKPNSAFFNTLADSRAILMPREMDDVGWADPLKFAGIGPWVITEWSDDGAGLFKAVFGYGELRRGEPHLECLRSLAPLTDQASMEASFAAGKFTALDVAEPSSLASMRERKPDANLYSWIDSSAESLVFNMSLAPFRDQRVRQAFHLTTDYKASGDAAFGQGAWAMHGPLHPGHPEAWGPDRVAGLAGYNPNTRSADATQALKLLAAAGYPSGNGIAFDLVHPATSSGTAKQFGAAIAGAFSGVRIAVKPLDASAFTRAREQAAFGMLLDSTASPPDAVLDAVTQYQTGAGRNYGRFSDQALDGLLDKALGATDRPTRSRLMEEYQRKWESDWRPRIVLHANAARRLVQPNLGGYEGIAGTWQQDAGAQRYGRVFFVGAPSGNRPPTG